jgi:hypothetical protein
MITINAVVNDGPVRLSEPQSVEVYVGAMESYEVFHLGGVRWKFPTGMVEDLLTEFKKKRAEEDT